MFELLSPAAAGAVLEAVQIPDPATGAMDLAVLATSVARIDHVARALRAADCDVASALRGSDTSAVVPTSPGAVPYTSAALDAFRAAGDSYPDHVSAGRLLIAIVETAGVRPGGWERARPALGQFVDPPA